jgi:AmiR/NasT family two-component response regulator
MRAQEPFASGDADLLETDTEFAELVRVACEQGERADDLEASVTSARTIGMATGILMARDDLTADQAFDELRRVSRASGREVVDVADEVVFSDHPSKRPR